MLKNIIFDFGGVICTFNQDALLTPYFPDSADHAAVKPIVYRDWAALDAGTVNYDAYAAETLALLPQRHRDAAQRFFADWYQHMQPLPQTWALIGELKARGYRLYILSNSSTHFARNIDYFPIVRLMDGIVCSAPVQMAKPDPAIYLHTLAQFQLCAPECLFIDDNSVNADAAENCGLHGYTYDGDADRLKARIFELS